MRGSWACTIGQPLQCHVSTEQQDSPTSGPRCVFTWPLRQSPPCPRRWSSWARKVGPGSGSEATAAEDDGLSVERTISARTRLGSFSGLKREPLVLFNSPEWRRTEFGGSSGHSNAQGLGRILAALSLGGVSQGVRLLSPAVIGMIFQEQAHGIDSYYMRPIRWGIGYALASEEDNRRGPLPFLRPGRKTCFWYGSGGSLAIADVERRITYTYAMNQCQSGRSALNGVYYKAFHDCLGA